MLTIIIVLLFGMIMGCFYKLQIEDYNIYTDALQRSTQREKAIQAERGLIFDRYGRVLAMNKPRYALYFNQQVGLSSEKMNEILLEVIRLMESNGDTYVDAVPISKKLPFTYTKNQNEVKNFIYKIPYKNEVHRQELATYTAEELMDYLRKEFDIGVEVSDLEARKLIALRSEIYAYNYKKYELIELASSLSIETVSTLEERASEYPALSIETKSTRYYPSGEAVSSILGYLGDIDELDVQGDYTKDAQVGKMGLEKSLESTLKGINGLEVLEVDTQGKSVSSIVKKEPVAGDDVYLSVDLDIQLETYESIERALSQAIIARLKGEDNRLKPLTSKELIYSLVECNQLSLERMQEASSDSVQKYLYNELAKAYEEVDPIITQNFTMKDLLLEWILSDKFSEGEILLALQEQGNITLGQESTQYLQDNPQMNIKPILIEALEQGGLKPSQMTVAPYSASAVMIEVDTGKVLGLVNYPSYDNNEMTTNFSSYYNCIAYDDRSLLWNRVLKTTKAPGSIFKMITAIAGLEEGVIKEETYIEDKGIYEEAGNPYPKCWIYELASEGHGLIDLEKAIEVSCNYYFYEIAERLSDKSNPEVSNVEYLIKYVQKFGLDKKTGIELEETVPSVSSPENLLKSRLSKVFKTFINEDNEATNKRIQEVESSLKEGVLELEDFDRVYNMEEEIAQVFSRILEPKLEEVVQNVLVDKYDLILNKLYTELRTEWDKQGSNNWLSNIISVVESSTNDVSRTLVVKEYLKEVINTTVGEVLEEELRSAIEYLDSEEIIKIYEKAYVEAYRQAIRSNSDGETAKYLREILENLSFYEEQWKNETVLKIRQNMINVIVNNLLNGVELEWTDGITVRSAIGQGNNAFSALQLARYIAILANGKYTYDLTLLEGIYHYKSYESYVEQKIKNCKNLNIREESIRRIHEGMLAVAEGEDGTAKGAFDNLGIQVAAKTGTAEESDFEHSYIAAFAPYEDPEVAVVVTLYEAEGLGAYGQKVASDMLQSYFGLDISQDNITLDNIWIE